MATRGKKQELKTDFEEGVGFEHPRNLKQKRGNNRLTEPGKIDWGGRGRRTAQEDGALTGTRTPSEHQK